MTPDRRNGHGPDLTGGVLINAPPQDRRLVTNPKDQRELTKAIREHQLQLTELGLRNLYTRLNLWADRIQARWLPDIRLDKPELPDVIIGVAPEHLKYLAHYKVHEDELGLYHRINFNAQHFREGEVVPGVAGLVWDYGGEYGMVETMLHEYLHHDQQIRGDNPYKGGNDTHNPEWHGKAAGFGLRCNKNGSHKEPAGPPFQPWMEGMGYRRPDVLAQDGVDMSWWFKWFEDAFGGKKKGRSTLDLWVCPDCGFKLRVGKSTEGSPAACPPCTRKKYGDIPLVEFSKQG